MREQCTLFLQTYLYAVPGSTTKKCLVHQLWSAPTFNASVRAGHSGFSYKIWSDPELNIIFEICGTGSFYKKYFVMLVRQNLASMAFRVHCAMYCQLGERKGNLRDKNTHRGFLYKIWSDPDLNMVFEICGTGPCYKKYYLMLVGPNLASIAFESHSAGGNLTS